MLYRIAPASATTNDPAITKKILERTIGDLINALDEGLEELAYALRRTRRAQRQGFISRPRTPKSSPKRSAMLSASLSTSCREDE
jgi:hypothetical protein